MGVFTSFLYFLLFALPTFFTLSYAGLLPRPFLSLFALINHYVRGKGVFKQKSKRKFNLNEVLSGLFVGNQPRDSTDLKVLRKLGIDSIISLNEEYELYIPSASSKFKTISEQQYLNGERISENEANDDKFERLHIPVPDYQGPTVEMLEASVKYLAEKLSKGKKVYVHCNGGKGRSVAVAVAYLLATEGTLNAPKMTYEEAVKLIKKRRSVASKSLTRYPVSAQSRNLKEFEKMNQKTAVLNASEINSAMNPAKASPERNASGKGARTLMQENDDVLYVPPKPLTMGVEAAKSNLTRRQMSHEVNL